MDENLKDLDENLALLTQKTGNLKSIEGTLLPPPTHIHTQTQRERERERERE